MLQNRYWTVIIITRKGKKYEICKVSVCICGTGKKREKDSLPDQREEINKAPLLSCADGLWDKKAGNRVLS